LLHLFLLVVYNLYDNHFLQFLLHFFSTLFVSGCDITVTVAMYSINYLPQKK